MKKLMIVFAVFAFVLSGCVMNTTPRVVTSHHIDRLKELISDNNHYDIVFIGDSLTEGGNFEKVLKGSKNAGIGGDYIYSIEDVVPIVAGYNPRKVYLMTGTNSLRDYSCEECVYQYKSLIKLITTTLPNAEIVVESVLPVSYTNQKIVRFNDFVKSVCAEYGLRYVDLYSMYSVGGLLPLTVTEDGVHLSPSGYNKWYEFIKNDNKE